MAERPRQTPLRWRLVYAFSDLHVRLYRVTRGRVGGRYRGAPVLLLDHVGRKSGKRRTHPLLYMSDGDDLVIVASKGGSSRHPVWWLNLRDRPATTVQVGGERREVTARVASPEEKSRLWPRLVEMYPPYEQYQSHTKREIPVIVLERGERG